MYTERNNTNTGLAKTLAIAIGENPSMVRHYDDEKQNSVDILSLDDPLDNNKKFYCTIGLSDIPTLIEKKEQNFGVEIFLVAYKNFDYVSQLLSTCAYVGKNKGKP